MTSTLAEKLTENIAAKLAADRKRMGILLRRVKRTDAQEIELIELCGALNVGPDEVRLLELAIATFGELVAAGEQVDAHRAAGRQNDTEIESVTRQWHEADADFAKQVYTAQERQSQLVSASSEADRCQRQAVALQLLFPELGLVVPDGFPSRAKLLDSDTVPPALTGAEFHEALRRRGLPG
jgi:hypothetical protein